MFRRLRRRITRGYVLLAITLIVAVVAASTALAFLLYARGVGDAVSGAAERVSAAAARSTQLRQPLEQAAPAIVAATGRSRLRVVVLDAAGHVLAQNERAGAPSAARSIVIAIGRAIGLPRARITISGGTVIISADFDRFGSVLLWYWSIMLPIGVLAVVAAWIAGRRITSGAVGPLAEVTRALRTIAAGDLTPQRVLNQSTDLSELTAAYNEVAYTLAASTAQREKTETQMRQFIADAGHELRTPLTIIMGYLDVLKQGIVKDAEGTQRTYATMLDESRKMRRLIDTLILLARLDRAQTAHRPDTPVNLAEVTRRVITALEPLAAGRLNADLSDKTASVIADESELYDAVKNIVENALKYSGSSPVTITMQQDHSNACVRVSDTGPGMDEQDLAHAFDRFYRGSARGDIEGSGLGLAIAKRAVERAGGSITLDSAAGEGTRVLLCLPAVTAPL